MEGISLIRFTSIPPSLPFVETFNNSTVWPYPPLNFNFASDYCFELLLLFVEAVFRSAAYAKGYNSRGPYVILKL